MRKFLVFLFSICSLALFQVEGEAQEFKQPELVSSLTGDHEPGKTGRLKYLAFVSSGLKNRGISFADINNTTLETIKDSPFNCFGVVLPTRDLKLLSHNIEIAKKSQRKFWIRIVFANKFVGGPDKVMQLWDDKKIQEALSWITAALTISKQTGAGGIFIDQETYTNLDNYQISFISEKTGKSPDEIINRLRLIGGQVADLANTVFEGKEVTLWFLFADLNNKLKDGYGVSTNFIVEGILARSKQKNYKIKVIDGGSGSIALLHLSLSDLKRRIPLQRSSLQEFVVKYYPHFQLGGVTVLFYDINSPGLWSNILTKIPDHKKEVQTIKDYQPLLELLFNAYEYVWIFQSGAIPDHNDFDPHVSKFYRPVIRAALPPEYLKTLPE